MPAVDIWLFAFGGAALARSLRWRRRKRRTELKRTLLRAGGAIACLFIAIVPAQVAISQARLVSAIGAMQRGQCGKAVSDANSSLSAVSQRPAPYTVIAFCDMREGRFGSATVAMERALQRDNANWELYYGLAVARAGAGLDPSAAAKKAAALNPLDELAGSAPHHFRGNNRHAWEREALSAPLLPPGPGDP